MNFLKLYLLALTILLANNIYAQVQQEWVSIFNGSGDNYNVAGCVKTDNNGNVYITGYTFNNSSSYDYLTIKYNSLGIQQWVKQYNGNGNRYDKAFSLGLDNSGNVYITGFSYSSFTNVDIVTIKYNTNGDVQWTKIFDGQANEADNGSSIAVDNSGNSYVTGWSENSSESTDFITIKYDVQGNEQWVKLYNGTGNGDDYSKSISIDNSGNVYVTGESYGNGTGKDFATIKYNSGGIEQWVQRYHRASHGADDAGTSIISDNSGNVYVTGYSFGYPTAYDYTTIKYSSTGNEEWVQIYIGPVSTGQDKAYSIKEDNSGNVYVTGSSTGIGTAADIVTIKYNSSGNQQWIKRYSGNSNGNDSPNDMIVDGLNNIYVTGYTTNNTTFADYLTLKYDTDGNEIWQNQFNSTGNKNDIANSISLDISGNVYVTGNSIGNNFNFDYTTIKYSQITGITPISSEIPTDFKLYQNYPNPFNPKTSINFQLPVNSNVKLLIFDILGRNIETLVDQNLSAGVYKTEWNTLNFPSGIYYYRLTTEQYSETKKMVLIK